MRETGIQPWPRDAEMEAILADPAYGTGTMFGPLFAPGVESDGLASELRMARRVWEPKPACGGCGAVLRFEHIFIRLSVVRYGTDVAALCGDCVAKLYSRLRSVSHASGEDRHRKGIEALNSAFELMVMGERTGERRVA